MARRLGTILVDLAISTRRSSGTSLRSRSGPKSELLGKVAVRMGVLKEEQVLKALGEQLGMKVIKLSETTIPAELTELVNETMATAFKVVPVSQNKKDKSVTVALAEPQNPATIDSLHRSSRSRSKESSPRRARSSRRSSGSTRHQESIEDVVKQIESDKGLSQFSHRNENTIDLEAIEEMAEAAPVAQALEHGAAPGDQGQGVRRPLRAVRGRVQDGYRVDGVLYELVPPPRHLAPAISSRIKVMANLDIAERRLPRTAGSSSHWGQLGRHPGLDLTDAFRRERGVAVLDRTVVQLDLNKIGMPRIFLATWRGDHAQAQRNHPRDGA